MAENLPRPKATNLSQPAAAAVGKIRKPKASASASPGKATTAKPTPPNHRALVVGVSRYPTPIPKLPAVAADVREVAKVLASRNGTFPADGVTALTERSATKEEVLVAVRKAFTGAKADDTIFVYLAGHGAVEDGAYYYVAYDTKADRLAETGVPLKTIKRMFERTASRKVFLLLDFCHSGGITERGTAASDVSAIQREIGVVQGSGKIIFAACAPAQSAYEDSSLGHGLFTDALLRGLKGDAKNGHGEVTALSLYEFIDHEVKHPKQQPTLTAQIAGRIIFAYYPTAGAVKPADPVGSKSTPASTSTKATATAAASKATRPVTAGRITSSGNLVLLDGRIYISQSIHDIGDEKVEVKVVPRNAEEEAALRSLRRDRFHSKLVSFAFGNQAYNGRVEDVSFQMTGPKSVCTLVVKPEVKDSFYSGGMIYGNLSPEQMGEAQARILLLDEKPSDFLSAARDSTLHSLTLSSLKEAGTTAGIFPSLYKNWKGSPTEFLRAARLWAMYHLKSSGTCDDILELALGPLRAGVVSVTFRGRKRNQYSLNPFYEITVKGQCALK